MPDRKANIPERPCLRAVQAEPEHYSKDGLISRPVSAVAGF